MKIITRIEKISSTYDRYTCCVAEKNCGSEDSEKFVWKMWKLLQNILRDVEERIMVYYKLADVVRELRSRLNMTQEELAAGICSVSSIAKIESKGAVGAEGLGAHSRAGKMPLCAQIPV